jgi:ubiquinone biosynthesis UbiH/UbiF/VisC/COQ6 family hydroxylase
LSASGRHLQFSNVHRAPFAERGSGIVAMCAALALARLPLRVVLHRFEAGAAGEPDLRAYALNAASIGLLRQLKVWDSLGDGARTPVHDMLIHGDRAGASLRFSAWQQGVDELACIVDAGALESALREALRYAAHVELQAAGEPLAATLVVHAEGKFASGSGPAHGSLHLEPYGHRAIAARLLASQGHANLARQWFRQPDVLALLPLDADQPGLGYGLVWSLPEQRCAELLALDDRAFEQALNDATQLEAGTLRLASRRAAWPLFVGQADSVCGRGWVRIGDAAHVVHPLAGQGLNLGLGDVISLAGVLAAREPWRALDDPRLLARHARARLLPVQAMAALTDRLLHLFASPNPALRELRNAGLQLVDRLGPAKRWLAAQAMSP